MTKILVISTQIFLMVTRTSTNTIAYMMASLFGGTKLCLPATSIREHVVQELHSGGCSGHLGRDKAIALVDDRYYWSCVKANVISICERCHTCQLAKGNKKEYMIILDIPNS